MPSGGTNASLSTESRTLSHRYVGGAVRADSTFLSGRGFVVRCGSIASGFPVADAREEVLAKLVDCVGHRADPGEHFRLGASGRLLLSHADRSSTASAAIAAHRIHTGSRRSGSTFQGSLGGRGRWPAGQVELSAGRGPVWFEHQQRKNFRAICMTMRRFSTGSLPIGERSRINAGWRNSSVAPSSGGRLSRSWRRRV